MQVASAPFLIAHLIDHLQPLALEAARSTLGVLLGGSSALEVWGEWRRSRILPRDGSAASSVGGAVSPRGEGLVFSS